MDLQHQTFWDHLDDLRSSIFRAVLVSAVFSVVAFVLKDVLFNIVLAPQKCEFVTYRLLQLLDSSGTLVDMTPIKLVNYGLAQQFVIHVKTAIYFGALCASPYLIYLLFRFVSPALYSNERRYALSMVTGGYIMFMLGVLLCYFLIFPLTFRFLGTYQVSEVVENTISLESYMDTLLMMCLMMGIVFEIPILCLILSKLGFIDKAFMRKYRRHAIVVILVVAAVITPTSDAFTLFLVSAPMYMLYELSILMVSDRKK